MGNEYMLWIDAAQNKINNIDIEKKTAYGDRGNVARDLMRCCYCNGAP